LFQLPLVTEVMVVAPAVTATAKTTKTTAAKRDFPMCLSDVPRPGT